MDLVKFRALQIKVAASIILGKSQLMSLFLWCGLSRQMNFADVRLQQLPTIFAAFTAPVRLPDFLSTLYILRAGHNFPHLLLEKYRPTSNFTTQNSSW